MILKYLFQNPNFKILINQNLKILTTTTTTISVTNQYVPSVIGSLRKLQLLLFIIGLTVVISLFLADMKVVIRDSLH
jgi:hypothetical protein